MSKVWFFLGGFVAGALVAGIVCWLRYWFAEMDRILKESVD